MLQPIIEFRNISKFFRAVGGSEKNPLNGHLALSDIQLSVYPKDVFGIIGMSGAGKSTLMRCLLGLENLSSGGIFFHDRSIDLMSAVGLQEYRKKIGMIFQQFNLFPSRTAAANVAYPMEISGVPLEKRQQRVLELLQLVGLEHKKDAYPSSLSGGEKQRIGIARALANRPEILICDEATSALDPGTMRSILSLLQELNRTLGVTIIAITHQLDAVKQMCTKVGVLSQGKLVEQGLVADVFANPKHQATKQLLLGELPSLPEIVYDQKKEFARLYRLNFNGQEAREPIISRMLKRFDVEVNILQASLDSFQKVVLGVLVVEFIGAFSEVERALAYLKENQVHCEEMK